MAWNLSTGMVKALEIQQPEYKEVLQATTISFGDGDGSGGRDTIRDSGNGLDQFSKHDFILICDPSHVNRNTMVKALSVTAGVIEVAAGSLSAASAGNDIILTTIKSGSLAAVMQNMTIRCFTGARPSDADQVEDGSLAARITLNGNDFVAGVSENGLNFGQYAGGNIKRAIDPDTANVEVWKGEGLLDGTIAWVRVYDNDLVTGLSETAVRMDGVVGTTSGDVVMSDRIAAPGKEISVLDVVFNISGTQFVS